MICGPKTRHSRGKHPQIRLLGEKSAERSELAFISLKQFTSSSFWIIPFPRDRRSWNLWKHSWKLDADRKSCVKSSQVVRQRIHRYSPLATHFGEEITEMSSLFTPIESNLFLTTFMPFKVSLIFSP